MVKCDKPSLKGLSMTTGMNDTYIFINHDYIQKNKENHVIMVIKMNKNELSFNINAYYFGKAFDILNMLNIELVFQLQQMFKYSLLVVIM